MEQRISVFDIDTPVTPELFSLENQTVRSVISEFRTKPNLLLDLVNSIDNIDAPYIVMTLGNPDLYFVYDRADNILIATYSGTICGRKAHRDIQGTSQGLISKPAYASLVTEYFRLDEESYTHEIEWAYDSKRHSPEEFLMFGGIGFFSNEDTRFTIDIDKLRELLLSGSSMEDIYPQDIGLALIPSQRKNPSDENDRVDR